MNLRNIFIFFIFPLFILGCEQPPIAEMDSAREAVFRAENNADAVSYGSSSLVRARDALNRMQSEADSKRYDAARTHAAEAIAAAEKAIADGRAGADRARTETAYLVSGLPQEIEDANRNVNGARYSQLDLDYDSLEREIINAYNLADQAQANQDAGRYQDALNDAMSVRANLSDVNQRVAGAVVRKK